MLANFVLENVMKNLIFAGCCLIIWGLQVSASALETCEISLEALKKRVFPLEVYPGYGFTIDFSDTGKTIVHAWLDNVEQVVLSSDGGLCHAAENQNCSNQSGSTIVHLNQIKKIDFPDLLSSADGGTLLTLVTEGRGGRSIYQFRVLPTSGLPRQCTALAVNARLNSSRASSAAVRPRRERTLAPSLPLVQPSQPPVEQAQQTPPNLTLALPNYSVESSLLLQNQSNWQLNTREVQPPPPPEPSLRVRAQPQNTQTNETKSAPGNVQANDITFGLIVAAQSGQINYGTRTYRKVQNAIRLLRRGETLSNSASRSQVPLSVLQQLIRWGQNRPGRFKLDRLFS